MPQQTLGELFTSVVGGLPGAEDLNAKASTANPVFTGSISLGRKADTTVGTGSIAIGNNVTASGNNSIAFGNGSKAEGSNAIALSYNTIATGTSSIAASQGAQASGIRSVAVGNGAYSPGNDSIALGPFNAQMTNILDWVSESSYKVNDIVKYNGTYYKCKTANNDSDFTNANWTMINWTKKQLLAIGNGTENNIRSNALTLDWTGDLHLARDIYINANADGTGGTKLDTNILAPQANPVFTGSISLGRKDNTTVGNNSFAVGSEVEASGDYSHAEGRYSKAQSDYSHAEGYNATASNTNAHAEGDNTTASGQTSHAEGRYTTASGNYGSHAEGNYTTASGNYSHSEGYYTTALGSSSHSSGVYSVEMTRFPTWTANTSYAVGDRVRTALGNTTLRCINANNDASFTNANWETSIIDTVQAFVVGNGTADNARSNALTLDWTGDLHLMGDLYTGANANGTGGTKLARIPDAPSTDGTYILQCVVSSGVPTYSWISAGA